MNVFIILIALLIIFLVYIHKSNNRKKYSFDEAFSLEDRTKPRNEYVLETNKLSVDDIVSSIETKILQQYSKVPPGIHFKIRSLIENYAFSPTYLVAEKLTECLSSNFCNKDSIEVRDGIIHYSIKQWIMYSNPNTFDDFIRFMTYYMKDYSTKNGQKIIEDIEDYTRNVLNF